MSIILDALRRLEEKRAPERTGEILKAGSEGDSPSRKRTLWPWFLIAALGVNVLFFAGWLTFRKGDAGPAYPVPRGEETAGEGSPSRGRGELPPKAKKVEERPARDLSAATDGEDGSLPRLSPEGGRETAAVPEPPPPLPAALPETGAETPPLTEAATVAGPQGNGGVSERAVEEASSRVYQFKDLPREVRDSLEDLKIVAHVYSDDPLFRLLSVGSGLQREGETVRPGLLLREISPQGATFVYGGYSFQVKAY